jgi:hypothetical protein
VVAADFPAHGIADLLELGRRLGRLDFDHECRLLSAIHLKTKGSGSSHLGVAMFRCPFKVLGDNVSSFHNDQVFDAAGYEQLSVFPKTQITCPQEEIRRIIRQASAEYLAVSFRLPPVARTNGAAAYPDFAHPAGFDSASLSVDQFQTCSRAWKTATHNRA